MKEKKNIDRLFQEKFKDFEATPPDFVWDNIAAELNKKKKRRVIPIWFRLSGAAAILLIGLLLINPFGGEEQSRPENNPVVNSNGEKGSANGNSNEAGPASATPKNLPGTYPAGAVASGNEETSAAPLTNAQSGNARKTEPAETQNIYGSTPNGVADRDSKRGNKGESNAHRPSGDGNPNMINSSRNNAIRYNENSAIAGTGADSGTNTETDSSLDRDATAESGETGLPASKPGLTKKNDDAIADNANTENNDRGSEEDNNIRDENPIINRDININDAVAETEVDTAGTEEPENELEKILKENKAGNKEQDKVVAEASSGQKWQIMPQVAPVFYNSLSQGSPMGGQFAGNSKEYDNNMSYGVGVDYALNDRISIRSGINTVNLSYSTKDVEFYPSMSKQTANLSKSPESSANIVVQSADASSILPADTQHTFNGSLLQEMGYIEVPVEMSYALLNRKFGVEVIGGFSTLFLNDNNVSVVTDQGYSSPLGQAQNLNNIHFTTNVGLGFRYRFTKAFQAKFEPTFKYQMNAFSGDVGNYKPYFIGLYSGISFSF